MSQDAHEPGQQSEVLAASNELLPTDSKGTDMTEPNQSKGTASQATPLAAQRPPMPSTPANPTGWRPVKASTPDPNTARRMIETRPHTKATWTPNANPKPGVMALVSSPASNTVQGPASITELARALENNADNIFEWVYTNIEFTPTYGVQRGALGCLVDGRGNAFDMTMLLVELLRAAGYTANYMMGEIELPASVATNWLGTVANPAWVTDRVLNFGGIPTSYTWVAPDDLDKQTLSHVYAKVTISGTAYMFDPALKAYTYKTGMNLATAMGYSQSTLISDALSGATQTSNYIDDLNRANVRSKLNTYANNLVSYIKANNFAADLDDVLGGRTINALTGTVRNTVHPYKKTGSTHTEVASIASSYYTTLRIQVSGIDVTLNSHDLASKRLTLWWNGSNQPVLRLDGTTIATGTAATVGTWEAFTHTITHNGISSPNVNQTINTWAYVSQYQYCLIGHSWGTAGKGGVDLHTKNHFVNKLAGNADLSESVLGEKLAYIWDMYNSMASGSFGIIDRMGASWTSIFHNVGMITYFDDGVTTPSNILVSDWGAMFTTLTVDGNTTKELANAQACILHFGTLEGLAISAAVDIDSVNAARMIDTGISQSNKIFDATSSNWTASVKPNLAGYSSQELSDIENNYINWGWRLIIPERGDLTWGSYTGDGFFAIDSGGGIVHYINGTKGGGGANGGGGQFIWLSPFGPPPFQSPDPIDLVKGNYLYTTTDITIGSQDFPYQLPFQRMYNSGDRLNTSGPLGLGWKHNFQMTAKVVTDGFRGLGEKSPIDAAASIVSMYVCYDLLNQTARPLERWLINATTLAWWIDQMWRNGVVVDAAVATDAFIKLPDASYNAQPDRACTLVKNGDGTFTYKTPQQVALNFNSAGDIATWVDPAGVTITFTYTSGKLTSVSNALGRTLTLSYTGNYLSSVSDGTGRSVSYSVNTTSKQLTSFTDPDSKSCTFEYDSPGRLIKIFLPRNPTIPMVTNEYDSLDRVKTQKDALNHTSTFYFAGSRSVELDPVSNKHTMYFNRHGMIIRDINALGHVITTEFDGRMRVTKSTLPEGNAREFTYDTKHNVLTVTMKAKPGSGLSDLVNSFTWHTTFNRVLTKTDGRSNVTTYTYDSTKGRLLTIQRPQVGGQTPTVTMTYNSRGQLATRIDETGIETRWNYDTSTEKLTSIVHDYGTTPHLNLTTSFGNNSRGDITSVTNPRSHQTTYDYDLCRRLKQKTDPSPSSYVTKWTYDTNGNLTKIERQTGDVLNPWQTTTFEYTDTDKRKKVIDPSSNFALIDYDSADRLWKITDEESRVTTFAYDAMHRLSTVTDPTSTVSETHTYTNNGFLSSVKDARNKTTSYSYEGHDRLDRRTFADSSYDQHVSYDGNSNLLTLRTRSGNTVVNTWDVLDRLSTRSPQGQATVTFEYDLAGRLKKASKPVVSGDPSTGIFENFFDTAGRFYKETYPDAKAVEHVLDANGNRTKTTWPDGYYIERVFDQLNRLTDIKLNGAGSSALVFQYNDLSLRKKLTYQNGCVTDYAFELDNDLNSLVQTFVGSSVTFTYGFNKVHELTSQSVTDGQYMWHPAAGGTVSYGTANDVNQYPTVGGVTHSYDSNGNLTGDGTWTYGYDTENHLLSASKTGVSASFVYDGVHRQAQKTVGTTKTRYIYSGVRRIADYDGSTDALQMRYVYGTRLDEPLIAVSAGGTLTYLHHDRNKSIIATTNSSGNVTNRNKYGPFGETPALNGTTFGYTGQRYDSELELYFYKARYFSPKIGRFLQPDPIGYTRVSGLNLYTYVGNSPYKFIDPLGTFSMVIPSPSGDDDGGLSDLPGDAVGGAISGAVTGGVGMGIGIGGAGAPPPGGNHDPKRGNWVPTLYFMQQNLDWEEAGRTPDNIPWYAQVDGLLIWNAWVWVNAAEGEATGESTPTPGPDAGTPQPPSEGSESENEGEDEEEKNDTEKWDEERQAIEDRYDRDIKIADQIHDYESRQKAYEVANQGKADAIRRLGPRPPQTTPPGPPPTTSH